MKMKVTNEYVLIEVAQDEEKTASGIIMSATKQERKYEGWVRDVGTNPDIAKFGIKIGDYAYYPKGLNKEVIIDGKTFDVVSIYDILAIGEEE